MFVLSNMLTGVAMVLSWLLVMYQWILIARAVLSWINPRPSNPLGSFLVSFIYMATEPALRAVRRLLPTNLRYFPLDIAFLVLFALVIFAQYGIVQSLLDYAFYLRQPQPMSNDVF